KRKIATNNKGRKKRLEASNKVATEIQSEASNIFFLISIPDFRLNILRKANRIKKTAQIMFADLKIIGKHSGKIIKSKRANELFFVKEFRLQIKLSKPTESKKTSKSTKLVEK